MADSIRRFTWSATPLGAIESWHPALIFAVSDILESRFPSLIVWGPERIGLYNDGCVPIFGERPNPLGLPFDVAWSDIWDAVRDVYDDAFAGSAGYREDLPLNVPRPGLPDLSWWTFSCSPIRDGTGLICGVRAVILETTARVRLEQRQTLLLTVGDILRQQKAPAEITETVCAALGRHFQADRVGYGEIDTANAVARLGPGWTSDGRSHRARNFDLPAFGSGFIRRLESGRPSVVADVDTDPLTADATIYPDFGVRSILVIPLTRDGRWVNALSIAMARPHAWTQEEVDVATSVAERTWEAVERCRVELSLRESRERLDTALEAARMVAWNWDAVSDRIDVSGSVAEVFGLRDGEGIDTSHSGFSHVHPDDLYRHRKAVTSAMAGRKGYVSEFRIIRPRDGEIAWLEERARPHRDHVTGKFGLAGLVWDVTRRKRAEIASEEARREVADELTVLTRLHDWAVRVASPSEWQALLDEMLAATMDLLQADFGTIRIYDPDADTLTVIAERGCDEGYVARFRVSSASDHGLIWHRPMRSRQRVVYDDFENDESQRILYGASREFGFHSLQVTPLFDRSGAPIGALSTGFRGTNRPTDREWRLVDLYGAQVADVIGARRARDALSASEQRQRRLIESVPQLVWRSDYDGHATWHSPQWCSYTGLSREDSLDRGWLSAIHPDDRPEVMKAWARAGERTAYTSECRIWHAQEQRYRWFQERAVTGRTGEGGSPEWIGTSTDIDALRTLHEQQRALLKELQQRVRQTLLHLRSIVRRTASTRDDVDDYVSRLDSRLDALARAQGPALRDPSSGVDLSELVANELTAHQAREGERATVTGPPLRLRPGAADILALALHELAINAVEHGALSRQRGRIRVSWRIEGDADDPLLHFEWTETGRALAEMPGTVREGFGFSLLKRALADELKATTTIVFAAVGLSCTITLPLNESVVLP